jgi:hypothetical protein
MYQDERDRLTYAFGHLVSSYVEDDPHAGDSGDLAYEGIYEFVKENPNITLREVLDVIAEYVHGNYAYTGEAIEDRRRIERGEI